MLNSGTIQGRKVVQINAATINNLGGTLLASAGGDLNLIAAQLQSAGAASLSAQGNVNLQAATTGETLNFESHGEAEFKQHIQTRQQTGSSVQSAGNLSISAG